MRRTVIAVLFFLATSLHANDPLTERGFRPDGTYHLTSLDTVNLFNGNINITIPLGQEYATSSSLSYQFQLRYSSKAWHVTELCNLKQTDCRANARPWNEAAGLGWDLSFGKLTCTTSSGSYTGCTYTSPDGAEHRFYNVLHDGDTEEEAIAYTRDGTYLRLQTTDPNHYVVEFPSGAKSRFMLNWDNNWLLMYLYNGFSQVDAYGRPTTNYVYFTYYDAYTVYVQDSVLLDGVHLRTHIIHYDATNHLQSLELAQYKGAPRSVYTFTYETATIPKPVYFGSSAEFVDCIGQG